MITASSRVVSVLVCVACLVPACTNGWGSLTKLAEEECGAAHAMLTKQRAAQAQQLKELQVLSLKKFGNNQTVKDLADAQKDLAKSPGPDREKFMAACVEPLAAALKPCAEYKFGTDSAFQCAARRGGPVVTAATIQSFDFSPGH